MKENKVKKWVKEHEVTVMIIGSALGGAGMAILGGYAIHKAKPKPIGVDLSVLGDSVNKRVKLKMVDIYPKGKTKPKACISADIETVRQTTQDLIDTLAFVTKEKVEFSAVPELAE